MLQKFLFIGVGGSGGKTLRYVWRELDRRMRTQKGWNQGLPRAWQFLHIDVRETPDGYDADVPNVLTAEGGDYLGLASAPVLYPEYHDVLATEQLGPGIADWCPNPSDITLPPWNGAGQRRAVGRLITLASLNAIRGTIETRLNLMLEPEADEELALLSRALGDTKPAAEEPAVFLISSVAGGSGAGAFLDISCLLDGMAAGDDRSWLNNQLAILFMPDLFDGAARGLRRGVSANALGSVCEMLSLRQAEGQIDPDTTALLAAAGGPNAIDGPLGPRRCFIVSRSNGQLVLPVGNSVYTSVGKALAVFATDRTVQEEFFGYVDVNDQAGSVDFGLGPDEGSVAHCNSIGYASVGLGRELFEEYASERIARAALDRLMRGPFELDQTETTTEAAIVALAERESPSYFQACGLYELGENNNQVIDALTEVKELTSDLDRWAAELEADIRSMRGDLTPSELATRFRDRSEGRRIEFEERRRSGLHENGQRWAENIETSVLGATATFIGHFGYPVTLALLDLLDKQLASAADELTEDAASKRSKLETILGKVFDLLSGGGERKVRATSVNLDLAIKGARDTANKTAEIDTYELAAQLIVDVRENLVAPLRKAIRDSSGVLAKDAEEHDELTSSWPIRDIPSRMRPAPNDLLLVNADKFPEELDRLLAATFALPAASAQAEAVAEVIAGIWTDRSGAAGTIKDQSAIEAPYEWGTSVAHARTKKTTTRPGVYGALRKSQGLLSRSQDWVRNRRGPVSDYVAENLQQYLDATNLDAADRGRQFCAKLSTALKQSMPLAAVNKTALQRLQGISAKEIDETVTLMSSIPLGPNHEAYTAVREVVVAGGVSDRTLSSVFDATGSASRVEITRFYSHWVHPFAFDPLTRPIMGQLNEVRAGGANQFWQNRRTRSIHEFIPVSPETLDAMIRGFLVAGWLGYTEFGKPGRPATIWSKGKDLAFPNPLLSPPADGRSGILSALLESFALAVLADIGASKATHEGVAPYRRLIELGALPIHGDVGTFIDKGTLPGGRAVPEYLAAMATPEERSANLILSLENTATRNDEMTLDLESIVPSPVGWGLRRHVAQAARDLVANVDPPEVKRENEIQT